MTKTGALPAGFAPTVHAGTDAIAKIPAAPNTHIRSNRNRFMPHLQLCLLIIDTVGFCLKSYHKAHPRRSLHVSVCSAPRSGASFLFLHSLPATAF